MAKYILIGTSAAVEGRDDDYNDWYDNTHLGEVCAIPGIKSGRRYTADACSPNPVPSPNIAIYEIETDDPAAVLAELGKRAAAGQMKMTDSLDRSSAQLWLFKQR